eukprot:2002916-Alexandrium_andersonii.AAC.1
MIVGALRHFGKLPDDLSPSEVAVLRREAEERQKGKGGSKGKKGDDDDEENYKGWNIGCDMG